MTELIGAKEYELQDTLENTLDHHPALRVSSQLLDDIDCTLRTIKGLKKRIEEIYPYHCTDFAN